jgi:hypothetical protein
MKSRGEMNNFIKSILRREAKKRGKVLENIAETNNYIDMCKIHINGTYLDKLRKRIREKKTTYIDEILIAETTYKTPEKARELIEYELRK